MRKVIRCIQRCSYSAQDELKNARSIDIQCSMAEVDQLPAALNAIFVKK